MFQREDGRIWEDGCLLGYPVFLFHVTMPKASLELCSKEVKYFGIVNDSETMWTLIRANGALSIPITPFGIGAVRFYVIAEESCLAR